MSVSRSKAGDKSAVAPLSAEQRRVLEEAFDRTLDEYGDDAIGYLSGVSEMPLKQRAMFSLCPQYTLCHGVSNPTVI